MKKTLKNTLINRSLLTDNLGFTLIEILVVATIIGLLAAGGAVSYSQFSRQSRDAKRKADLEQIRAALEIYRSNNNYYPSTLNGLTSPTVYIQSIPQDPLSSQGYNYVYTPSPTNCINNCTNYTLAALLEGSSNCSTPPSTPCKSGTNCNYCLGPYGQK